MRTTPSTRSKASTSAKPPLDETPPQRKRRAAKIVALLKTKHAGARTALNYATPLELLVATILSAQCTDARVNVVTKSLFAKYKTAADYATADPATLEQQVKSAGFFRNKTKSILGACAKIVQDYGAKVPEKMEELLSLPGVARKTANVVLGNAFERAEGVVVDTHVRRVCQRLGLTNHDDPEKIEQDLMALLPRPEWILFSHMVIYHGRETCTARKPDCAGCILNKLCPSAFKV